MTVRLVSDEKIAETSSKGNQEKWKDGEQWYKLDQFGYEALAEVFTSRLLEMSNIETETPFEFVRYEMAVVNAHGHDRTGCVSKNFLKEDQSIITVNTLLQKFSHISLRKKLNNLPSDKQRIKYLADTVTDRTGLSEFGRYLTLLFEIDSLFVNDDRHLNNIAVIEENGKFSYCPIFDNGAGLLSNMMIYRTDIEPKSLIHSARACPFNMTFNRSLKTARELYGNVLSLPKLSVRDISGMFDDLLPYYPQRDKSLISERVACCILERQKML